MMIVYKVMNKINDKIYIGVTTRDVQTRFVEHCVDARYEKNNKKEMPVFHKAIIKYGEENFCWFIVEDNIKTREELFKKEIEYIIKYNSLIPNGYNMTKGGENPPIQYGDNNIHAILNQKEVDEIYVHLKEAKLFNSEIASLYNVHVTTIERLNSGKIRFNSEQEYPIRKLSKYEIRALKAIELLHDTNLSYNEISTISEASKDTITRINTGKRYTKLHNYDTPIRK